MMSFHLSARAHRIGILPPIVLALVSSCSGPANLEPGSSDRRPIVTVHGESGLTSKWSEKAPTAEVLDFQRRFDLHAAEGRTACSAALVRDFPEVALELFRQDVETEQPASTVRREQIAQAWQTATGSSVLQESEALQRGPQSEICRGALVELGLARRKLEKGEPQTALAHAEAAFETWSAMGERFFAEDAEQILQICRLLTAQDKRESWCTPAWSRAMAPTMPQETERRMISLQAALMACDPKGTQEALRCAKVWAARSSHWLATMRIEKAQDVVLHDVSARKDREWARFIGELALKRGHPLVALRYALAATRLSREAHDKANELDDRLLIVRSRLVAQQYAQALEGALRITQSAEDLNLVEHEAKALAMAGEALSLLNRAHEAVQAFERSRNLIKARNQEKSYSRRTINLALSFLRQGGESRNGNREAYRSCEKALQELSGWDLEALDPQLAIRYELAWSLCLLAAGKKTEARPRIGRALREAAAIGDYTTLEKYAMLSDRVFPAR